MKNLRNVLNMGIEGLMSLVKRVSALLAEPTSVNPVITKSSVLGLFIRRTSVIFEQLSCSGVVAVSKVFKRYCDACPAASQESTPSNAMDDNQKTNAIIQDFQDRYVCVHFVNWKKAK
jgi:hypothetical protein